SALDFGTEALNQFRRTFTWLHRIATQTRTISALQRLARTRKKINILSRRLFRRAGGPAENSRRAHSDKKYAFEARVAIQERAISFALFSMNEDRSTLGIWMTGRNCRVRK